MDTFTIICDNCKSERVSIWQRTYDGEYEGAVFKCEDCGAASQPY